MIRIWILRKLPKDDCYNVRQEVKTKEPLVRPTTWQWVYRKSWFESVPSIIQCTKYTISNHPLFQRSVLDVKLRERQRR
jgi:hypothetical protein